MVKPNNGDLNPELKNQLQGILQDDIFNNAFTQQHTSSAIEKFVDRGDTVEDLLLRGYFRDVNHSNACLRLYRKAKHFEDKELEEMILNHIAAYPAIGGGRIDILLQAVIGYVKEKKNNDFGTKFKEALGIGERNDRPR